jgi:hypothetical protein
MVLAMGRHRFTALICMAECTAVAGMAIALRGQGLVGVCVAFAVGATVARGVIYLTYGSSLVHVPVRVYVGHAVLVPLLVAALPMAALAGLVAWHSPTTFGELLCHVAGFALLYVILMLALVRPWPSIWQDIAGLMQRSSRRHELPARVRT